MFTLMRYDSYTKTDSFYEFASEGGQKLLAPLGSVILVDDGSGLLSIKGTASRATIGTVPSNN